MSERVVVIGGGVGGLVSAALLATRGCDVTVVEKEAGPGGKLRALEGVDAGPTVFTMRHLFDELFDACGSSLDSALTIQSCDTLARHAWGDTRLDLFADPARSEAAIGDMAGAAEARGYRAFRAESRRIFEALDAPFLQRSNTNPLALGWRMGLGGFADYCTLRPYTSLWSALGGYFRDPRLQQLFGRYATYCGSSPFRAPATLMLIAHVEAMGVWTIEGGMHRLATALADLGERNGVRFRYGAAVGEIAVENGRASGVTLTTGERIAADSVICNADPAALGDGAFGATASRAVRRTTPARRSLSALVWTGHANTSGFPLERHNVLFSDDYPAEFAALARGQLPASPSVYLCAQQSSGVQIIGNAPPEGASISRGEIERCQAAMQARLEQAGLSLDWTGPPTLTTPAQFAALCPSTGGALYGPASHGWAASFRRQSARTRIPGLYCAGGSTHPGAGVPMAALSGRLAAMSLLADRVSTSGSRPAAMPGGMSTPSARIAASA